jgi:hypothetical protein
MQPELAGQDQALAQLAEVVRFEAARNMSNITIAQQQVASVLDSGPDCGYHERCAHYRDRWSQSWSVWGPL